MPRDHDGDGLVCPSCRRLLKIPRSGDNPPPLLAPVRSVAVAAPLPEDVGEGPREEVAEETPVRRKRSSRNHRRGETHSWEANPRRHNRSLRLERRHMIYALAAGAGVLGLILASVWSLNRRERPEVLEPIAAAPAEPAAPRDEVMGDAEFLNLAEPVATAFLEARNVEEILPLVRHPETTGPRIRAAHPDGKLDPPGLSRFNLTNTVTHKGGIYQVAVETRDYDVRSMSFVNGPDGMLVDWESWVGWSEMPWEEFLAAKPAEPKLFRVIVRQADYYNFGFSDEEKWRSYQLDSPDHSHSVYGYAERGGICDERLRANPDAKESSFVVELRFPSDVDSRNQVIIDRVVTDGWAIESPEKP
ncbi:MAG: hypothetical protein H7A49_14235 [Akkermansiaceae bacterium]|nr:hypothetical protein [Akkermansiaceae bacterium]MCP5545052.1 hypothetical protein [Akkermansiaceae bacterium]MCP5546228.1 hypothetical protein [Akkermansiaceae bacterium]